MGWQGPIFLMGTFSDIINFQIELYWKSFIVNILFVFVGVLNSMYLVLHVSLIECFLPVMGY